MGKLKIGRDREGNARRALRRCRILFVNLANGETVKRGCGGRGLMEFGAGWKCFYCGAYVYRPKLRMESLWFHFKMGREYWRMAFINGWEYINGVPVVAPAEHLPQDLLADLAEIQRPAWFDFYVMYEEEEFKRYLKTYVAHRGLASRYDSPPSLARAKGQRSCPPPPNPGRDAKSRPGSNRSWLFTKKPRQEP